MTGGVRVPVRYRMAEAFTDLAPPVYASDGAAGADLRAALDKPLVVAPGERVLVPTGLVLEIPSGLRRPGARPLGPRPEEGARARERRRDDRRGLPRRGGRPRRESRGGARDADPRGPDRAARVAPVARAIFEGAADLVDTARGAGGFGSTGAR